MNERIGSLSSMMVDILNKPDASITNKERDEMSVKLGEILMYLTRTIHHCGLTLDDIMQQNIDIQNNKLQYENVLNRDIFRRR